MTANELYKILQECESHITPLHALDKIWGRPFDGVTEKITQKDEAEKHEKGRASQYLKWRESLNADRAFDNFSKREEAIAFAAFLAGWWLRTGENPSEFWNPTPTQPQ